MARVAAVPVALRARSAQVAGTSADPALREQRPQRPVGGAQLRERPALGTEVEHGAPDRPEHVDGDALAQALERRALARDDEAAGVLPEQDLVARRGRVAGARLPPRAAPAEQAGLGQGDQEAALGDVVAGAQL